MGVALWGQVAVNGHIELGDRVERLRRSRAWRTTSRRASGWPASAIDEKNWARNAVAFETWSDVHANFIVNLGGATAADVLALIRLARRRV